MLQKTFFIGILVTIFFIVVLKKEEQENIGENTNIELLQCDAQLFMLSGAKGGEIVGMYGTHLTFPKNGFVNSKGEIVQDSIDIQLIEFHVEGDEGTSYHPEATDDSSILTNGTFELMAFYNNEPLQFHPNVDLEAILLK